MGRGKLFFTTALPRAGKTTWANIWLKGPFSPNEDDWPNNISFNYMKDEISIHRPRVVLSGDSFRHAVYGREYYRECEGLVFAHIDVAARALLATGFDVLIDETCTTDLTLLRYLRIDRNAQPIFFDTPEEVCVERALAANKPFLVKPIKMMAKQLAELRSRWDETVARLIAYLNERESCDNVVD